MKTKTWTRKIAGACVAGAVLAGAGMTAAVAAPATVNPPVEAYTMSEVTNLTPYTWTFHSYIGNGHDVAPPQQLQPGQTASWPSPPGPAPVSVSLRPPPTAHPAQPGRSSSTPPAMLMRPRRR